MSDDGLNPSSVNPADSGGETPFSHNVFESPESTASPLDAAVRELVDATKASTKVSEASSDTLKRIEDVSKDTLDLTKDKADTDEKNRDEDEKTKAKDDKKRGDREKVLDKERSDRKKSSSVLDEGVKGGKKAVSKKVSLGDELVGVINTAASAINNPISQLDKVVTGFVKGAGNLFGSFFGGKDRVDNSRLQSVGGVDGRASSLGLPPNDVPTFTGGLSGSPVLASVAGMSASGTLKDSLMGDVSGLESSSLGVDGSGSNDPQALFFGSPERSPAGRFIASFFKKEAKLGKTTDGAMESEGGGGFAFAAMFKAVAGFLLPILGIIAVIAALVFVFKENKALLDDTMKSLSLLWDTLKQIITEIVSIFNSLIQAIDWEAVKTAIRDFAVVVKGAVEGLVQVFGGIWDGLEPLRVFLTNFINGIDWSALSAQFKTAFEQVSGVVQSLIEFLTPIIVQVKDTFFHVFGIVANLFNKALGHLKKLQPFINQAFEGLKGIFSALGSYIESLMPFVSWLIKIGVKAVGFIFKGIKGLIDGFTAGVKVITSFVKDPAKFMEGLIQSIKDGLMSGVAKVKSIFEGLWGKITGLFSGAWDGMKKGVGDAQAVMSKVFDAVWGPLDRYVFNPLKQGFEKLVGGIVSFFKDFQIMFDYMGADIKGKSAAQKFIDILRGQEDFAEFKGAREKSYAELDANSKFLSAAPAQALKEAVASREERTVAMANNNNQQNNVQNTTYINPVNSSPHALGSEGLA